MSRAVRVDAPGRLTVVEVPVPTPAPGEALIRVGWAGICGSDRDLLDGTRPAPYVRYPIVPGHEWSGTVAGVGDGVDPSLTGRLVVGEGFRSCQVCEACRRGDTTLCAAPYDETGFTADGAWADHLTIPARLLHVLPDGADLRAAAGLEPAACAAEAFLRAELVPGLRVAVVGGGTLGLLTTQLVRACGPAELLVVDPASSRGDLAGRCGATAYVSPAEAAVLAGRYDVVVEAAGVNGSAAAATRLVRRGGRVVLLGLAGPDDHLGTGDLVLDGLTVTAVFGAPTRAWVHAVRAFTTGALDPSVLVTHEYVLEDAAEAFRVFADPRAAAGKVLLRP